MPYKDPEKKNAWMRNKRAQEKSRQSVDEILKSGGTSIPGEPNLTVQQLQLVYNGDGKDATSESIDKDDIGPNTDWNKIKRIRVAGRKGFDGNYLTIDSWLDGRARLRRVLYSADDICNLASFRPPHFPAKWSPFAHSKLFDVYVKKDNTTLPFNYSQDDMNEWLAAQSNIYYRMVLFPRGFRKSTSAVIDTIQWIINCPDTVHLFCTSTRRLGKIRASEAKSWFEVEDYNNPTLFQVYFPEFCIPQGEGPAGEYKCPVTRLKLPYATIFYTSAESSGAGNRATHIVFDDTQDEKNYREVEMRQKVIETFDAGTELITVGFATVIGTRYTDGKNGDNPEGRPENTVYTKVPDLYGEILLRNEGSDKWIILIEPAWRVKLHAASKPIREYVEDDVDLLMPDKKEGSFENLLDKAKKNESWFRCQQLNEPAAPSKKDDDYINLFTEDNIRPMIKDISQAPKFFINKFEIADTALTVSDRADYTACVIIGFEDRGPDRHCIIWFLYVTGFKAPDSKIAETIVRLMRQYDCPAHIEDLKPYNDPMSPHRGFKGEIERQRVIQQVGHVPGWFTPTQELGAKETRIRSLQRLHERGLLRFVSGTGSDLDLMISQLINYNGDKKLHSSSRTSRKDDLIDAMSQVYRFLPPDPEMTTPEDVAARERRIEADHRNYIHTLIFGTETMNRPLNPDAQVEETRPITPIHDALSVLNHRSGPTVSFSRPKKE